MSDNINQSGYTYQSTRNPIKYVGELVGELRAAHWPSVKKVLAMTGLTVLVVAALTMVAFGTDSLVVKGVLGLRDVAQGIQAPVAVVVAVAALQAASLVTLVVLAMKGPTPTGNLTSIFGGGVSDTATGQTPAETRLSHRTAVVAVIFGVLTLVLGVLL